ncbi:MAG: hypothetical protein MK108_08450 [Mariniblastus sp.]|nr:hypothetical protein [Mariniblastus sp.]
MLPGNLMFYAIVGLIVFGLVGKVVYAWFQYRRKKRLREVADELGLEYIEDGQHSLFQSISDLSLFRSGRSGKSSKMICGDTGELTIGIFDYSYVSGSGDSTKSYTQSVIALLSDQIVLPRFNLQPQGILHKLIGALGVQDIDFEEYPEFSRMFFLQGEDEQGIRDFFDAEWIDFLARFQGYCIEGKDGALIFYRPNKQVHPDQIKEYLSQAYDFFGHIIERAAP